MGLRQGCLLTGLLLLLVSPSSGSCSACFLRPPRPTCLGNVPRTVDGALLHQLSIKKMPLTHLPTGHSDLGNSLVEISSPFPSDSSLCQVDSHGYGDLSLLCPFNIHSVQWSLSAPVVTHFLLHDSTFSYLRDTYGLWVTVILLSLRGEGFLCVTPVSFSSSAIGVDMCLPFFRDPEL